MMGLLWNYRMFKLHLLWFIAVIECRLFATCLNRVVVTLQYSGRCSKLEIPGLQTVSAYYAFKVYGFISLILTTGLWNCIIAQTKNPRKKRQWCSGWTFTKTWPLLSKRSIAVSLQWKNVFVERRTLHSTIRTWFHVSCQREWELVSLLTFKEYLHTHKHSVDQLNFAFL